MPLAKPLSKLERVPLREAWKHEAGYFTPWLAEAANLDALGGVQGLGDPHHLTANTHQLQAGSPTACGLSCRGSP